MATLAALIGRFIDEMNGTNGMVGIKPLGESHLYALKRLSTYDIAQKAASELKKQDFIDFAKWRRTTVCPATANQDVCIIGGVLKYAGSAWEDCEDVSEAPISAARPLLMKYRLIGKSQPRDRRPTDEELERLTALFEHQNRNARTKVNMVPVVAFALVSSRRISEICRITWGDVDFENKVYWVRDLKHPTKKKGNDKQFILFPELERIILAQPRLDPNNPNERIFPFHKKTCSARYTRAKKKLGIQNLRFHDNRGEAISRWLAKLTPHDVRIAISGHENTVILERVYDRRGALDLVKGKLADMARQANAG